VFCGRCGFWGHTKRTCMNMIPPNYDLAEVRRQNMNKYLPLQRKPQRRYNLRKNIKREFPGKITE